MGADTGPASSTSFPTVTVTPDASEQAPGSQPLAKDAVANGRTRKPGSSEEPARPGKPNTNLQPPPPRSRPTLQRYYSLPMNPLSPARHRFRLHNAEPHHVKETGIVSVLEDARGTWINEYQITRVVGRGAYGIVFLSVDPRGEQYALKECSKRQLAKLNRAALMRIRRQVISGGNPAHLDVNSLIRREVAVMKKLDHPNLVTLYEVLDDPNSESLVLVLEWCPDGTIMPPEKDYDGKATPLDENQCRLYFRDIVLGIEYLHARGVCHRDIKADNVLIGENDVAKIADFGVSEIFDIASGDNVQRPVGSPAYMSPELVAMNLGRYSSPVNTLNAPISGRKADIWAMGVLLFYMFHGKLPFEAPDLDTLQMRITLTEPELAPTCPPLLQDLFRGMLDKNPATRISLEQVREHPWLNRSGSDPLLSREENVQVSVDDGVTEEDILCAIELIEHRKNLPTHLDYLQVSQSLRNMHGWHGVTDSETSSGARTPRRSSMDSESSASSNASGWSPSAHPVSTVSSGSALKMEKLSEALEEVLRLRTWQTEEPLESPSLPAAKD